MVWGNQISDFMEMSQSESKQTLTYYTPFLSSLCPITGYICHVFQIWVVVCVSNCVLCWHWCRYLFPLCIRPFCAWLFSIFPCLLKSYTCVVKLVKMFLSCACVLQIKSTVKSTDTGVIENMWAWRSHVTSSWCYQNTFSFLWGVPGTGCANCFCAHYPFAIFSL